MFGISQAYLTLLLVLLGTGVLTWAGGVFMMALLLLRPPRMTDGKAAYVLQRLSPGDLAMAFEDEAFRVRDLRNGRVLSIAGWWIPHPAGSERCVVLVHGYADAKVGAIAWAPLWQALGFHILAIDLRAHGASEGSYSTAGFFERHDLAQAIDDLRARRPEQTRTIGLFGVSLGAAAVAALAVERPDLAGAVVLESPYADFPTAAATHARLMRLPTRFFHRPALRVARWLSSADLGAVRPVDLIPKIRCPVMVIQSGNDPLVPPPEQSRVAASARREAGAARVCWTVDGAGHVLGLAACPTDYAARLAEFIDAALDDSQIQSPTGLPQALDRGAAMQTAPWSPPAA